MRKRAVIVLVMVWMRGVGQCTAIAATPLYTPLSVGNRWVYESSEGTTDDPVLETWEIVRQEGPAFVVRVTQPYLTINNIEELLTLSAEGLTHRTRTRTDPLTKTQTPGLILKLPPVAGANWTNENGRYAITGDHETVTVPAGTFSDCVEVTHWASDGNVTVVTLYAPGVGMVQREEQFPILGGIGGFDAPARGRTVLRLKEWTLQSSEFGVQSSESKND